MTIIRWTNAYGTSFAIGVANDGTAMNLADALKQSALVKTNSVKWEQPVAAVDPDRHCVGCGAVLLKLPECPHCGTAIQDQPA